METGTPAPGPFEARYHNAMPGWVKIKGLDIKSIDQCEGGGFAIREDHWRAITQASAELTQARAQVATLEARVMVLYAALRSEAIVPCGRMPDKGDEPMLVSHRCNVCWTEWELEEPESHKADCPLSAIPSSPDINGRLFEAVEKWAEDYRTNGMTNGTADGRLNLWTAFERFKAARAQSQPSTTGEG